MLRTDKRMVELPLEDNWKSVKNAIVDRLIETFCEHPNCFFTEHDIHSVLYNIAKEELRLNGSLAAKTSDGYEVMLVHHEFPTPFRCSMKELSFEKKDTKPYRRGHYDLVILNPKFVKNNKLAIVYGKDFKKFSSAIQKVKVEPLIWACEVIFFPRVKWIPKNALKIIEQDALKVKETLRYKVGRNVNFCKMGSVLAFTGHTAEEASDLELQLAKLTEKHDLEVILSTATPEENLKPKSFTEGSRVRSLTASGESKQPGR